MRMGREHGSLRPRSPWVLILHQTPSNRISSYILGNPLFSSTPFALSQFFFLTKFIRGCLKWEILISYAYIRGVSRTHSNSFFFLIEFMSRLFHRLFFLVTIFSTRQSAETCTRERKYMWPKGSTKSWPKHCSWEDTKATGMNRRGDATRVRVCLCDRPNFASETLNFATPPAPPSWHGKIYVYTASYFYSFTAARRSTYFAGPRFSFSLSFTLPFSPTSSNFSRPLFSLEMWRPFLHNFDNLGVSRIFNFGEFFPTSGLIIYEKFLIDIAKLSPITR